MGSGTSKNRQNLPDLPQDIIFSDSIGPVDDIFEPKNIPRIKHVKLTKKEYKIPISIYSKTLRVTINNKSLYIYFKYKATSPSTVKLYIGVQSNLSELPKLQRPVYESALDVEAEEFSSQGIKLDDNQYKSIFYNINIDYVPIAIAFGDATICQIVYSGFHLDKDNRPVHAIKRNYMVKDKKLYPIQEVYGVNSSEGDTCLVCLTDPRNVIITPCFHCCVCSDCSKRLSAKDQRCPLCRTAIADLIDLGSN